MQNGLRLGDDGMTENKRLDVNKIDDLFVRNELIRLYEENEQLKYDNKFLRCTIESNSQDDYIDYLEKQNEILKERITDIKKFFR